MSLAMVTSSMFTLVVLALVPVCVVGDGFLKHDPKLHRHGASMADEDFRDAMASVMGCGSSAGAKVGPSRLVAVEKTLGPIWRALPKNEHGRIEWRMLRYVVHRYFMQQSSLLIRGLEPARQVNDTHMGTAEILNKHVPSLVETVLEGKRSSNGFSLEDAVALAATLEQVILDSEGHLLEESYRRARSPVDQRINMHELDNILEIYLAHWIVGGDDREVLDMVIRNRSVLGQEVPHWYATLNFAKGVVQNMDYARQHSLQPGHGLSAMTQTYSFSDVHEAIGGITKSFASYWEAECQAIKSSLVKLDKTGSGRISLQDFYGANADGEWRFGESEAYLRELGALDETSPFGGKKVIIPNYLLGASNCIVTTSHYFVCCMNECEPILNEIEAAIGMPHAEPDEILPLVANMTVSVDFEDPPKEIPRSLTSQLRRIAEIHNGKVPLHGRLFAQWLHYIFPRECPFPHKAGAHAAKSPTEFGDSFIVSEEEVKKHASERNATDVSEQMAEQEESQFMSQWSEEEELIVGSPYQTSSRKIYFAVLGLMLLGLAFASIQKANSEGAKPSTFSLGFEQKAHFV